MGILIQDKDQILVFADIFKITWHTGLIKRWNPMYMIMQTLDQMNIMTFDFESKGQGQIFVFG